MQRYPSNLARGIQNSWAFLRSLARAQPANQDVMMRAKMFIRETNQAQSVAMPQTTIAQTFSAGRPTKIILSGLQTGASRWLSAVHFSLVRGRGGVRLSIHASPPSCCFAVPGRYLYAILDVDFPRFGPDGFFRGPPTRWRGREHARRRKDPYHQ